MDGMVLQKYPDDDFWSFLPAQIWDDSWPFPSVCWSKSGASLETISVEIQTQRTSWTSVHKYTLPISQANQLLWSWVKQFHKILQSQGWPIESPQSPPRLPAPLHPHSDSSLYLTHSTTNQSGGGSRRQCPRTPHSWRTRSSDLVLTTTLAGGCCMPVNVFSVSMDCWLCGVSVHISTSTPPQIQHFPPSGLRLWDVTPPP